MKRVISRCLWVALLVLANMSGTALAQSDPKRSINQITGNLYRFQNQFHFSVFLVTAEGIIVTDPINADAARWLKGELGRRFPGKPVKYLIYSHSHADHVAGGEVFSDTATVVAHEKARARIVSEQVPTAVPQVTFSDRKVISLGGKTIELIYFGPSHSDNLIVMRFPGEGALFAVDIVAPKRLPYRDLPDADVEGWIDSLKAVERLEFDILVPGHGTLGNKADVSEHRIYLESLRDRVRAQMQAGKSLEAIKQIVTMEDYKDWGSYNDWRGLNVEGMYRYLTSR